MIKECSIHVGGGWGINTFQLKDLNG